MKKLCITGISCVAMVCMVILGVYLYVSRFDYIGSYNEFGLAKAEIDGKYGYIDEDNNEVIPIEFNSVGEFGSAGMVVVKSDEGAGIYGSDGACILPLEYQDIELGDENKNELIPVTLNGEANFMDKDGTVIFEATAEGPLSLLKVQSGGKYGYVDADGTEVLPCEYADLEVLSENSGTALLEMDGVKNFMDPSGAMLYDEVGDADEDGWIPVTQDGSCGYVTAENETVFPIQYASLVKEGRNSAGYIRVKADSRLLLADEAGKLLYQDTREFEPNNLAAVQDEKGHWGYIDRDGEVAVACLYDEVETFNEYGLSRARSGELYGYVDEKGVQVIPCIYDELVDFNEYGYTKAREGENINFISVTGQKQFDQVGQFSSEGVTLAGKGNEFFFIDEDGNRISESGYDSINSLGNDGTEGFLTCKGIRYGFTDGSGQEIIPAEYDDDPASSPMMAEYCLWTELKAELDSITAQAANDPTPGLDLPEIIEFRA